MNRITERIYIGDWADWVNLRNDNPQGITAVLDCTGRDDGNEFYTLDKCFLNQADRAETDKGTVGMAIGFLADEIRLGKKVLIHCEEGVSRSAIFTILWLMYNGFGWDEAESLVRNARPIIAPNPILKESAVKCLMEIMK